MPKVTLNNDADKADLLDQFATAQTQLEAVRDGVEGSTLAQTQLACRRMAVIELRMLRVLWKLVKKELG